MTAPLTGQAPPGRETAPAREVLVPVGPLISQIPRPDDGFPSPDLAEHWRPRGCGIACLRMILSSYRIDHGSYWSLISEGLQTGAYCDRGWIHQGLLDMATRHGLPGTAHRNRTTTHLSNDLLAGHLLIASVTVCFRGGQPRSDASNQVHTPGGHLVVVTGTRLDNTGGPTEFRVHHPSATPTNNLSNHWVTHERFAASFSGNYLTFPDPGSTPP